MLLRLIDGTAYNSEERLDKVNQTYLELACGNLVQQQKSSRYFQNRYRQLLAAVELAPSSRPRRLGAP